MRRLMLGLAGLSLTLALVACSAPATAHAPTEDVNLTNGRTVVVQLPDGREVLCVSEKRGYSGGLSCDWAGAE